jgi:hypothetical protein
MALAGCGSNSPGEVIVKPGVSAIAQSSSLACEADLLTLQTAYENFTLLNSGPPASESDLVPDWLRSESQLYDLIDGQIVPAADSGCPAPPAGATGAAPGVTVADATARDCRVRYRNVLIAVEAYFAMNGVSTMPTEQNLVDAMLLPALDEAYDVNPDGLVEADAMVAAVPGGICDGVDVSTDSTVAQPSAADPPPVDADECTGQRTVLEIAIEAYVAAYGSPPTSESDLVPDWLRSELSGYDIVDGTITPAPDSICT